MTKPLDRICENDEKSLPTAAKPMLWEKYRKSMGVFYGKLTKSLSIGENFILVISHSENAYRNDQNQKKVT